MKNNFIKASFIAAIGLTSQLSLAQGHWITGGNIPTGIDGVPATATNNFLGSAAGNNTWLRFGVNGNQDIFIDNNPTQLLPAQTGGPAVPLGGHWVGLGRIFQSGIGANSYLAPQAHLHIHGGNNSTGAIFTSGIRDWMQTGTLYTENSNGMYTGLKSKFNGTSFVNESYAVINWSDDNGAYAGGLDFLSFNFTRIKGNSNPGTLINTEDGMELGRFDPIQGFGTFGVGNFYNLNPGNPAAVNPVRRVEVLDADPNTSLHPTGGFGGGAPQLRLTYRYDPSLTAPTVGVNTDFQTTSLGDMYINPQDNTKVITATRQAQSRFTGFHQVTPGNSVEINSQLIPAGSLEPYAGSAATIQDNNVPASWPGGTGASGCVMPIPTCKMLALAIKM